MPNLSWEPFSDWQLRPVAIIGAGVLGRRLAGMWASQGGRVALCDFAPHVLRDAVDYFNVAAKNAEVSV